jgi:uncharacterized protein YwgA
MSVLNELNENLDMSTFEARLLFQKKVFLLQCLGLPLNFSFGWYIRGPYSSELARTGFEMQSLYRDNDVRQSIVSGLPRSQEAIVEKARALFEAVDQLGTDRSRWYELVSGLLFIKLYSYPKPRNEREIFSLLEEKKPGKFSDQEKENAMQCIMNQRL